MLDPLTRPVNASGVDVLLRSTRCEDGGVGLRPLRPMVKLVDVARRRRCPWRRCRGRSTTTRRVDPQLAARVRAAATKLGYRPNYLARNLRRQRTSLWLLIISDIENVFFTSVARGVEDAAVDQPVLGRAVQRRRGRGQGVALRRAGRSPSRPPA